MTLTFSDAAIPTVTRTSEPNPFGALVAALAANRETAKTFTVPLSGKMAKGTETDGAIGKVKRQLSDAGKAAGITVRSTYEVSPGKGKEAGHVTFLAWAKPGERIAKPRKDKAAAK